MHHLTTSAASNLVHIRLTGFASATEVEALEQDFRRLFVVGKLRPNYFLLVDITDCAVQSQAVVAAIGQVASRMPKAQRIAVISSSAMLNMQLVRVLNRPYLRAVMDRRAALDWLLREEEPAQAA